MISVDLILSRTYNRVAEAKPENQSGPLQATVETFPKFRSWGAPERSTKLGGKKKSLG